MSTKAKELTVLRLLVEQCTYSAELNSRKTAPSPEKVQDMADSIAANGQIQPGLVRKIEGTSNYDILVGRTRYEAIKLLNSLRGKDEEPFYFLATETKADDKRSIILAVAENEKRFPTNVLDRADTMQRMLDLGMNQAEVANQYGLTEGRVSQILKLNKLPAKVKKMVESGDLQADAAEAIASCEGDTAVRDEIIEDAIARRAWLDSLTTPEGPVEEEEEEVEEEEEEKPKKAKKEDKKKAKKGAVKKGVVTKEDVKVAAKGKGAIKGPARISMPSLLKVLESMEPKDIGQAAANICGKLLEYIDSETDLNGLKKSLRYNTGYTKGDEPKKPKAA